MIPWSIAAAAAPGSSPSSSRPAGIAPASPRRAPGPCAAPRRSFHGRKVEEADAEQLPYASGRVDPPSAATRCRVARLLEEAGVPPQAVGFSCPGTTLATNAGRRRAHSSRTRLLCASGWLRAAHAEVSWPSSARWNRRQRTIVLVVALVLRLLELARTWVRQPGTRKRRPRAVPLPVQHDRIPVAGAVPSALNVLLWRVERNRFAVKGVNQPDRLCFAAMFLGELIRAHARGGLKSTSLFEPCRLHFGNAPCLVRVTPVHWERALPQGMPESAGRGDWERLKARNVKHRVPGECCPARVAFEWVIAGREDSGAAAGKL